jgi:hypothetical protein
MTYWGSPAGDRLGGLLFGARLLGSFLAVFLGLHFLFVVSAAIVAFAHEMDSLLEVWVLRE